MNRAIVVSLLLLFWIPSSVRSSQQEYVYESLHPYSPNSSNYWLHSIPGAIGLKVNFDNRSATEVDYDFVTLCASSSCNKIWGQYSGTQFPSVPSGVGSAADEMREIMIPADEVYIRFDVNKATNGNTLWGYAVTVTPLYNASTSLRTIIVDGSADASNATRCSNALVDPYSTAYPQNCSFRDAFSYCMSGTWAHSNFSAINNHCKINILEGSNIVLDDDLFPTMISVSDASVDFMVSIVGEGSGATVSGDINMFISTFETGYRYIRDRIWNFENLNFVTEFEGKNSTDTMASKGGMMSASDWTTMNFNNVNFSGFSSSLSGGAVDLSSVNYVHMSNVRTDNCVSASGGSIYITSSISVDIVFLSMFNNTASSSGGGLLIDNTLNIYVGNANFTSNNVSAGDGGGLSVGDYTAYSNVLPIVTVTLIEVFMDKNVASANGGGVYVMLADSFSVSNCTLHDNQAGVSGGGLFLFLDVTSVELSNSSFTENLALGVALTDGGGGVYITLSDVILRDSYFSQNSGQNGGGVFMSSISSVVSNCVLSSNLGTRYGGALYLMEVQNFNEADSTFQDNRANSGAGIYLAAGGNSVTISRSKFEENKVIYFGGGLYVSPNYNTLKFTGVEFNQNVAAYQGGGAYFEKFNHDVEFVHCLFYGNNAWNGGGLFLNQFITQFVMGNSIFEENHAETSGGGIYIFDKTSNVLINATRFHGNVALWADGGAMYVSASNTLLVIEGSEFIANAAFYSGGAVYVGFSNDAVHVQMNNFTDNLAYDGGALFSDNQNGMTIMANLLQSNTAVYRGGGIYIGLKHSSFIIDSNNFFNNDAAMGGGLCVGENTQNFLTGDEPSGQLILNTFNNNMAHTGGAIVFERVNSTEITLSTFFNNSALHGLTQDFASQVYTSSTVNDKYSGGAIALLSKSLNISISACKLTYNRAVVGSAVYSHSAGGVVLQHSTHVEDNVAVSYGTVFWAYDASRSDLEPVNSGTIFRRNYYRTTYLADSTTQMATQGLFLNAYEVSNPWSPDITITDYLAIPNISVVVNDYYNNLKFFDFGSSILAVVDSNYYGCLDRGTGTLSGQTTQYTINGVAAFTGFALSCNPGGNMKVFLSAPGLSTFVLSFTFANCSDGYEYANYQCRRCPAGYYSLEYSKSAPCSVAPVFSDAASTSADSIYALPGYWRINNDTTQLMTCPFGSAACLGQYASGTNSCSLGYQGPLCGVCSSNYYMNTVGATSSCLTCSGSSFLLLILPGLIMFVLLFCGLFYFLVYAKLEMRQIRGMMSIVGISGGDDTAFDAPEDEGQSLLSFDSTMGKLKILVSSYQIVAGFPSLFNVNLGSGITHLFHFFSFVNIISFDMPSASCYSTTTLDFVSTLMMTTLAPLFASALIIIIFMIDWAVKRSKENGLTTASERQKVLEDLTDHYFTIFLLLTYMVLPSVSSTIAQAYSCTDIDPDNVDPGTDFYLTVDLSISCNSSRYQLGVIWATIMLFVYPIGIPAMYYYLLYTHKEDITRREEKGYTIKQEAYLQLSFLFKVYEPKFWYWEIVETIRRLFFTFLLQFAFFSANTQIVISILVAVLFMKLYGFFAPYVEDQEDLLQEIAQYQVFFTLFGALIVQTAVLGPNPNIAVIIDTFLIVSNVAVTFLCIYYAFQTQVDDMIAWWYGYNAKEEAREHAPLPTKGSFYIDKSRFGSASQSDVEMGEILGDDSLMVEMNAVEMNLIMDDDGKDNKGSNVDDGNDYASLKEALAHEREMRQNMEVQIEHLRELARKHAPSS